MATNSLVIIGDSRLNLYGIAQALTQQPVIDTHPIYTLVTKYYTADIVISVVTERELLHLLLHSPAQDSKAQQIQHTLSTANACIVAFDCKQSTQGFATIRKLYSAAVHAAVSTKVDTHILLGVLYNADYSEHLTSEHWSKYQDFALDHQMQLIIYDQHSLEDDSDDIIYQSSSSSSSTTTTTTTQATESSDAQEHATTSDDNGSETFEANFEDNASNDQATEPKTGPLYADTNESDADLIDDLEAEEFGIGAITAALSCCQWPDVTLGAPAAAAAKRSAAAAAAAAAAATGDSIEISIDTTNSSSQDVTTHAVENAATATTTTTTTTIVKGISLLGNPDTIQLSENVFQETESFPRVKNRQKEDESVTLMRQHILTMSEHDAIGVTLDDLDIVFGDNDGCYTALDDDNDDHGVAQEADSQETTEHQELSPNEPATDPDTTQQNNEAVSCSGADNNIPSTSTTAVVQNNAKATTSTKAKATVGGKTTSKTKKAPSKSSKKSSSTMTVNSPDDELSSSQLKELDQIERLFSQAALVRSRARSGKMTDTERRDQATRMAMMFASAMSLGGGGSTSADNFDLLDDDDFFLSHLDE